MWVITIRIPANSFITRTIFVNHPNDAIPLGVSAWDRRHSTWSAARVEIFLRRLDDAQTVN